MKSLRFLKFRLQCWHWPAIFINDAPTFDEWRLKLDLNRFFNAYDDDAVYGKSALWYDPGKT